MSHFNKTILPNGIKILSESIPYVKSFSLGFWFNVGSRDESFRNNGITHFIEHMLFKGTKKRSARKIAVDIESAGGYLNAFTSKEHTCYYGRGLEEHINKTFDVISDMIQQPSFKPAEIKKESSVVVDELYDIEDNPEELIFDKFEEIIFAGNSLSLPIIGSEKNIKDFSQFDLFNYVKEKYGFNRLIISASGAVDHNKLIRLTDKYFNVDLGKSGIKRKHYSFTVQPSKIEFIDKEIQQVHTIIGKSTYGYKDAKRIKVALLTQVLGEGSSSRLFQSVREKNGIAYQINSFLNSFYDVSSFGVYFSTNEKMIDKAMSLVLKEFRKLRETKITDRELKKAKESIKGNLILSLENTSNRMIRMAQSELYYNRIKSLEEILVEIDSVTAEDIWDISNELLQEDSFIKVIIKSKNTLLKWAA
ncbi:MAG: pitrilysin family protein [Ignavibacteriaceae bacterium]